MKPKLLLNQEGRDQLKIAAVVAIVGMILFLSTGGWPILFGG